MLHHVSLQVAGLGEGLVAHLTLVRTHALVSKQVRVQVAQLLKQLSTQVASVWLDAAVPQDVRDQVVLGGVGLLTHTTLPSLLVASYVHIVAVINMDVKTQLLSAGHATSRRSVTAAVTRSEILFGVERSRGEVHDRARHEEGVW